MASAQLVDCISGGENTLILFGLQDEQASDEWTNKHVQLAPKSQLIDFKGEKGQIIIAYPDSTEWKRIVIVGLGKKAELNEERLRVGAHRATEKLGELKESSPVFLVSSIGSLSLPSFCDSVVTGSLLSDYRWEKHFTNPDKKANRLSSIRFLIDTSVGEVDRGECERAIKQAKIIADSVNFAKDLGNERPNIGNTQFYQERAEELGAGNEKLSLEILQFDQLKEKGLNLLAAVGQGAKCKSRLVIIRYNGAADANQPFTAVVGKGIIFDTGGINIKTVASIFHMFKDMCGAGVVLGVMRAVRDLNLASNILGVLCLADNAVDGESYYPSDIIRSYKGLTVEIGNTDAEGRLVLADGMSYVQKNYSVDTVIDLATLTGASVTALGETTANLFGNNETLLNSIVSQGNFHAEAFWKMPIFDEHRENMKSDAADLNNISKNPTQGGACTAAAFLENFIEPNIKWAHIDMAGPASYSSKREYVPKGTTGFAVRTLVSVLSNNKQ